MQEYPGTLADSYVKQDNNDGSPTYYISFLPMSHRLKNWKIILILYY